MTVREAIEALGRFPPDMKLMLIDPEMGRHHTPQFDLAQEWTDDDWQDHQETFVEIS